MSDIVERLRPTPPPPNEVGVAPAARKTSAKGNA